MLTPDDLNDTDRRVLDVLLEGRVTPQYVADQLDVSRTYASERLKRLVEHDHVGKVASGLYELNNDPRVETDRRPQTEAGLENMRAMINGIEKEIQRAERGEVDRDIEQLREAAETLQDLYEEDLGVHEQLQEKDDA
ncbi:MarR family transcriptional regulator [Haloarcula argentinensis]|uniref:MarR family transcriptional regulator n=2 Tax=Haloarcula argentinensis TaxID=43776 RepID=A0A847UDV6_HALAR|nr:MarR family transcriptional regulator [Haloarcula argentinensis]